VRKARHIIFDAKSGYVKTIDLHTDAHILSERFRFKNLLFSLNYYA